MTNVDPRHITKQATTTFYWAITLFPKDIQDDIFLLYAFVRTVDDFVDAQPPQKEKFYLFKKETLAGLKGKPSTHTFIAEFVEMARRRKISSQIIADFFAGQEVDLVSKGYKSPKELETFIYGVAEVIGLMMAAVMGLPHASHRTAQQLGRAMQRINILRDIQEDMNSNKIYFLKDKLKSHGLPSLNKTAANSSQIEKFIRSELDEIFIEMNSAQAGFQYIPRPYIQSIYLASEVYAHLGKELYKRPLRVYDERVKLSKPKMFQLVLKSYMYALQHQPKV